MLFPPLQIEKQPAESRSKVSQSLEGCLIPLSVPVNFQIFDIPLVHSLGDVYDAKSDIAIRLARLASKTLRAPL